MSDRPDTQQSFRERLAKNLAEQREILALMRANDALAWGLTPRPDHGSDLVPPRAVWLTAEDFTNKLDGQIARIVQQKWLAAPSDPTEAAEEALTTVFDVPEDARYLGLAAEAVLRALGKPDA